MIQDIPQDREIAALLPEYTPEGDATRILLTDGTERLYPRTLRATLRTIACRRCQDIALLRRWAGRYTHRTINNPIAASADLVLAPVKTRLPRVAGDAAMAHVNVAALRASAPAGTRSVIALAGGASVPALWSEKTTRAHLAAAQHICADLVRAEEEAVLRRLIRRRTKRKALNGD